MPSINMIAARRAEKHRSEIRTKNIILGIVIEAGLFLVALSFMVVQLVTSQSQIGGLNDQINKLKPQVAQIQSLERETAGLQPKLIALTSARDNTLYWYTAIENVTNSLSSSTWLANLSTSGDPTGGSATASPTAVTPPAQMLIAGTSLNQADVGLTMLSLNQYPHFDHVTLNFVQQGQAPGSKISTIVPYQFQIALQMHSTAPPKDSSKTTGNDNVQKS